MGRDEIFALAQRHHQTGALDEAQRLYEQLLQADPTDDGALHFLGVLYSQRHQYEPALQLIQKSLCLKPGESFYQSNTAKIILDAKHTALDW